MVVEYEILHGAVLIKNRIVKCDSRFAVGLIL